MGKGKGHVRKIKKVEEREETGTERDEQKGKSMIGKEIAEVKEVREGREG